MKMILIVQIRSAPYARHEKLCFKNNASKYFKSMAFVNAYYENYLPAMVAELKKYSCVIIAGTGESSLADGSLDKSDPKIMKLTKLLKLIVNNDFPYLGICFGHQLLGHVLGSKIVADDSQKEIGTFSINLTKEGKSDKLFQGLPKKFLVQHAHNDSVQKLPDNCTLLAKSDRCPIQAIRYRRNVYGTQFHPDMSKETQIERFHLYSRLNPDAGYTNNQAEVLSSFKDSPYCTKVLNRFLSIYTQLTNHV